MKVPEDINYVCLIKDSKSRCERHYLALEISGRHYIDAYCGEIELIFDDTRKLVDKVILQLPTKKNKGNWSDINDPLPLQDPSDAGNIYVNSKTCITYNIETREVYESSYSYCKLEWEDVESFGSYSTFKPTHWKEI